MTLAHQGVEEQAVDASVEEFGLSLLEVLLDHGRAAAEIWLRTGLRQVGRSSSSDVGSMIDDVLASRSDFEPVENADPPFLLPEIVPASGFE